MEEIIFGLRQTFRKKNNLREESTIIFLSPGNEENEITPNLKTALKAVEKFVYTHAYQ